MFQTWKGESVHVSSSLGSVVVFLVVEVAGFFPHVPSDRDVSAGRSRVRTYGSYPCWSVSLRLPFPPASSLKPLSLVVRSV